MVDASCCSPGRSFEMRIKTSWVQGTRDGVPTRGELSVKQEDDEVRRSKDSAASGQGSRSNSFQVQSDVGLPVAPQTISRGLTRKRIYNPRGLFMPCL
ncbi:hypothetical protein TNCT_116901 [Trichonephila clavata]|uniref:Uncharacterized protein n=1 Tax=Trichonephila clavata TaxID=2740835 RepID=A0A8X6HQN2_TRICU|nr:hypothetical protein TNCT_116901 [Trichonephila clavata]